MSKKSYNAGFWDKDEKGKGQGLQLKVGFFTPKEFDHESDIGGYVHGAIILVAQWSYFLHQLAARLKGREVAGEERRSGMSPILMSEVNLV